MGYIVNKVLFKYLVWLFSCFIASGILVIGVHEFFHTLSRTLDRKSDNLRQKIDITRFLLEDVHRLQISFLGLSAATKTEKLRLEIAASIEATLDRLLEKNTTLVQGGTLSIPLSHNSTQSVTKTYTPSLSLGSPQALLFHHGEIREKLRRILELLETRDRYFAQNHPDLNTLAFHIRGENQVVSSLLSRYEIEVETALETENRYLESFQEQKVREDRYYYAGEIILIALTLVLVSFLIYKIVLQIIQLYKELENRLYVDHLTKLYNRTALLRDIALVRSPAVLLIDINAFRTINELYGVEVGNEVLVLFSTLLQEFTKRHRLDLYRLSGDEFVILRSDSSYDSDACSKMIEKLLTRVKEYTIRVRSLKEPLYLDICIGVSFEKENLLGTADIALNEAKKTHTHVVFYRDIHAIKQEIEKDVYWKNKIARGIECDLFMPFFQPIVAANGKIVKYEALMRLQDDEDPTRFYAPNDFLETAIKTHQYSEISRMMLFKSIDIAAKTRTCISLNMSYLDLINTPFCKELYERIEATATGELLVVEFLESQGVQNYATVQAFVQKFRTLGVRFAIDDFGSGYSNYAYVFELSPDFIKIDGSLIQHIAHDPKALALVQAIVLFSQKIGIQTVAEFVYAQEVYEEALALQIDLFQGYYFGKPEKTFRP